MERLKHKQAISASCVRYWNRIGLRSQSRDEPLKLARCRNRTCLARHGDLIQCEVCSSARRTGAWSATFSEEQIIGILKEREAGACVAYAANMVLRHRRLQMKREVWRVWTLEAKRLKTGRREHAAETAAGRRHAGHAA